MITIISGTNRPGSNTLKVAKNYIQLIKQQNVDCQLFSLEMLPHDIAFSNNYETHSDSFQQLMDQFIVPVNKFVIISPEYNGSFPGILKVFFDTVHPKINRNKKAALVGVSNGRAGNLRGMDHLTGILHYLGIYVHPNKLPVSSILTLLDSEGIIKDENTINALKKHIDDFLSW